MRPVLTRRTAALAAVATTAALGLGAAAAPAGAATAPKPVITLQPVAPVALPATGSPISPLFDWTADRDLGMRTLTVKVDARGLAKVAKVTFSGECAAQGLTATCPEQLPFSVGGVDGEAPFTVTPLKGARVGATGAYTVTGSTPGVVVKGASSWVTIGGPNYDLARLGHFTNQKVGAVVSQPITFANLGNRPARGSDVALVLSPGLTFTQHYSNCRYRSDVQGGIREEDTAVCHFADWMRIGEKVTLAQPVRTRVTSRALWTYMDVVAAPAGDTAALGWTTASRPGSRWTQGHGPALGLKRLVAGRPSAAPAGIAELPSENQGHDVEFVTAHNWADYGVTGSSAKAAAGHDVTMSFAITNHGPAVLFDRSGGEATPYVKVTAPAGTTVVGSQACGNQPVNGVWYCSAGLRAILAYPGQTFRLTITFHVVTVVPHAHGLVRLVYGGGPTPGTNLPFDPDPKNNSASLLLN